MFQTHVVTVLLILEAMSVMTEGSTDNTIMSTFYWGHSETEHNRHPDVYSGHCTTVHPPAPVHNNCTVDWKTDERKCF